MKTLDVNLPGAAYPIHIGAGTVESHLRDLVEEHGGDLVVVVTNETLAHMYPRRLEQVLESLPLRVATCTVPDGERFKTFATNNVERLACNSISRFPATNGFAEFRPP